MKQIIQKGRSGKTEIIDVPCQGSMKGCVLVRTAASVVSVGTERMVVDFSRKNIVQKARARPDLVRQVLDKSRREGFLNTMELVRNRLDHSFALGYSSAGTVIGAGEDIRDFGIGDRVACAGAGYAAHAEVVNVPRNLVAHIPASVDFESAGFTTLGSIALHGLRLAAASVGEYVAVIGLGLLGLLAVQISKASGCRVMGIDLDPTRVELARRLGADLAILGHQQATTNEGDLIEAAQSFTNGRGFDSVILTAATSSNEPVEQAGIIARDRGCVVAVGAVGMAIPRKIYYEKELRFLVSRSYGPGRYDREYEEKGHDYPIGYVRWTENRNMQAFLQLLAENRVQVSPLITHRFSIEEAGAAYDLITGESSEPFLGVLIIYPQQPDLSRKTIVITGGKSEESKGSHITQSPQTLTRSSNIPVRLGIGVIGAGSFATAVLLPTMKKSADTEFIGVCSATGVSARHASDKFGFRYCTTDDREIFNDPQISTAVIATRHHLHAGKITAALNAGKHVFCEKPLCLNESELMNIVHAYSTSTVHTASHSSADMVSDVSVATDLQPQAPVLAVGFNRRFAPMAKGIKAFIADVQEPLVIHYRVNAGYIPPEHWVHDTSQGGGRIIGEVCHFVDFLIFLTGASPHEVQARALPNNDRYQDDNVVIMIEFSDGSLGTITYLANGDKTFPKERVELFGEGSVAVLDDFRRLELIRSGRKKVQKSRLRQDKGHVGEWKAFVSAIRNGGPPPIPFEEIVATTRTTFAIVGSLRNGTPVIVKQDSVLAANTSR